MLLHPVSERYNITANKQDGIPSAGEITLLKICNNRSVNTHDLGVAILLPILFTRHS